MAEQASMTVAGIDPGLANLGMGVVRQQGKQLEHIASQLIRTQSSMAQAARLQKIYDGVHAFLSQHRADALAIEGQFFRYGGDSAFKVGQAVGVALLAAQQLELPIFEYAPNQVKKAIVGTGAADKAQMAYMVRATLGMKKNPQSHHVADALALAMTHLSSCQVQHISRVY